MPFFRKAAPRDPLIVAMTGASLGSRVLILAADDTAMPVDLAAKVGLSGQAVALAPDAHGAAGVARRAERRGIFLEAAMLQLPLPFQDGSFDIVVADRRTHPSTNRPLLGEAFRVLRPGGRIVVLEAVGRWSWRGVEAQAPGAGVLEDLLHAGFRAARELAVRERIRFIEAARAD